MSDEYYEDDRADVADSPAKKRRVVRPAAHDEAPAHDDHDEAPKPKVEAPSKPKVKAGANGLRGGWTAGQQVMESSSQYAQNLKLDANVQIIKFLDDFPYVNYSRHWIQRANGKRSYTCLGSVGKDCPLCSVDPRPQSTSAFNVAVVGDDGGVLLKTWDVGPKVFNILKSLSKTGLTDGYYKVNKFGDRNQAQVMISDVDENTMYDKFGIEAPSAEAIEAIGKYDADIVTIPSVQELSEIAAEISGGDDY
jgi:hypothetical protein